MNVLSTEIIYTRQSGAEGGSGKEVMRGIWKGVSEGEGRGGEQGAFQEGLIGGGDTQPWKRGGGGHCRELRAGGGGWNIKWDTKEAREVAGGRGGARASLVCMFLPICCFITSTSPFRFCYHSPGLPFSEDLSFVWSVSLGSNFLTLSSSLTLDNLLILQVSVFLINKMRIISVLPSLSWGLIKWENIRPNSVHGTKPVLNKCKLPFLSLL